MFAEHFFPVLPEPSATPLGIKRGRRSLLSPLASNDANVVPRVNGAATATGRRRRRLARIQFLHRAAKREEGV